MTYRPSSFVGYCFPRTERTALADAQAHLARMGEAPARLLETASWVVALAHSPSTRLGVDAATGLKVLLHGEVLEAGDDPATAVAGRIARGGPAAALDLHGSFALLVVDPPHDRVAVVTDRVNSRRVYASLDGPGVRLSTGLAAQTARRLDPTGVAWFLANGAIHGSRTLLEGVGVLTRASWNEVTPSGVEARPYWRFAPGSGSGPTDERRLSGELSERLVAAVHRNVADDPDLFVSLSGGFDATAIVGALRSDPDVSRVRCFSYALGPAGRDSDERRAAETAALAGFDFQRVQSYDGDLPRVIEDNAALSQGVRGFVHEVDAWKALDATFRTLRHPVVLAGDECFGGAMDNTIRTREDVAASIGIRSFGVLRRLAGVVDPATLEGMADGMAADADAFFARCPPGDDARDCKDFLYLDERLVNVIAPWREGFAFPFATLRNPLLDNDILDFVAGLPSGLRRTKVLFRRTVARMYPDLFALPRAKRTNYMVDLSNEVLRHEPALRRLATGGESLLDDLVPPSATVALLDAVVSGGPRSPSMKARARDLARAALPPKASNAVRRYRPPPRFAPVDAATLVVRLLILRRALSDPPPTPSS